MTAFNDYYRHYRGKIPGAVPELPLRMVSLVWGVALETLAVETT